MSTANQSNAIVNANSVVPYERLMRENRDWGMNESSLYFEDKGRVRETLRRISRRLNDLQIPYAVVGGMALFQHGYQRYTEDVDILVTQEGNDKLHAALDGIGFVRPFSVSKNLRDTETGVKIEFLITGSYPGDGKPKEVAFPDPADVAVVFNDVSYVNLPTLITLKLTSGLTGEGRGKDIIDIFELIKAANLDDSLAPRLSPLVQAEYRKQCALARKLIRYIATEAIPAELLPAMVADGVYLDPVDDHYATRDPEIAKKYGMTLDSNF